MRTVGRAGAAAVVALALAACAEDNGGVIAGGDPDAPVSSVPTTSTGGGGGTAPSGARIVEPTPGLDGVVTAAIDAIAVLDESTLEVRFYNGVEPCYGVDHVTVDEGADAVTIEVGTGTNPDAVDAACIEIAELQAVRVTLAAPLGARTVLDASTGQAPPISGP